MAAPFSIDLKKLEISKSSGEVTCELETLQVDIDLASSSLTPFDAFGEAELDAVNLNDNAAEAGYFARGTLIATQDGDVAIEEIRVGDMVLTLDHGFQPVRWIGGPGETASAEVAPIRIREGTIGNTRELYVSPTQGLLLSGARMELLFGDAEVLAPAAAFSAVARSDPSPLRSASYHQLMFDNHEIIYAEGALAESLRPGSAIKAENDAVEGRGAEMDAVATLKRHPEWHAAARPVLRRQEARVAAHEMGLIA